MPALRVTPDIDTAAAAPRDGADEPRAGGDTKEDSQNETNESMAKELARPRGGVVAVVVDTDSVASPRSRGREDLRAEVHGEEARGSDGGGRRLLARRGAHARQGVARLRLRRRCSAWPTPPTSSARFGHPRRCLLSWWFRTLSALRIDAGSGDLDAHAKSPAPASARWPIVLRRGEHLASSGRASGRAGRVASENRPRRRPPRRGRGRHGHPRDARAVGAGGGRRPAERAADRRRRRLLRARRGRALGICRLPAALRTPPRSRCRPTRTRR